MDRERVLRKEYMESFEFMAAINGDTSIFTKYEEDHIFLATPDLNNSIVHLAVRHKKCLFIEAAINRFPVLLQQKNKKGNTPLHEAAELGDEETVNLLVSQHNIRDNHNLIDVPFFMDKNNKGDTPFHVALRARNAAAAHQLFILVVTNHPEILATQNYSGETPLHLYIRYCPDDQNAADKRKLIDRLITTHPRAVLTKDSDGLTPHMRAAENGRVLAALQILAHHNQLSECRDYNGRNFLHKLRLIRLADLNARDRESILWNCKRILKLPGFHALIFSQDEDGNTPLHRAIADRDFDVARLILQQCVDDQSSVRKELIMGIKNYQEKSVLDLITSVSEEIPVNLKKLMGQMGESRVMDDNLYRAALRGDMSLFEQRRRRSSQESSEIISTDHNNHTYEYDDDYFLCQADDGSNIIHIALQHGHKLFIIKALECFLDLIYQKDFKGDTPLHVAARLQSPTSLEFLKCALTTWNETKIGLAIPPWVVKNSKGNTFLHEAASTSNYEVISLASNHELVNFEAFSDINDNGETFLHLIARYATYADISETVIENLLKRSKTVVHMRDVDGLTPTLRAAQCGQIQLVTIISLGYPSTIQNCDYKGRTVLHLLRTSALKLVSGSKAILTSWTENSLINMGVHGLIFKQDNDGNTPLHLAITVRDFEIAQFLIKWCTKIDLNTGKDLMNIKNNDGKSVVDLIIYGSSIPANLKKMIEWATRRRIMDDKLYKAATIGDAHLLQQRRTQNQDIEIKATTYDDDYFHCLAEDGSNIIHIALRHGHNLFITKALESFFDLIYQKDSKGDTPLHVAARLQTPAALEFLKLSLTIWKEKDEHFKFLIHPQIWTVTNSFGNTFLHEAARTSNYEVLSLAKDHVTSEGMSYTNDNGENFLHLIARCASYLATETLEETVHTWVTVSKSCVHIRDIDGFTPVLRAVQCGRLRVAISLVNQFSRSIEICDHKSRTVLHHLKATVIDLVDDSEDIMPLLKKFIELPGVDGFRVAQDEDGNTPLHLAILNGDVATTKFLMELCLQSEAKQELTIVNKDGHSIFNLLSSKSHTSAMNELEEWVSKSYIKERQLVDKMMDDKLYQAARDGNVRFFDEVANCNAELDVESGLQKYDEAYFCRKTPDGSNIIHIALRHGNPQAADFINRALKLFPLLILEADSNGDTILHLAAKWKSHTSVELLANSWQDVYKVWKERNKGVYIAPWEVKNYKGNFPIHEALQTDNLLAARALLDYDEAAATRVNVLGETPLHAYAKYGFSNNDDADKFAKTLISKNNLAAYIRDNEGFTPLLRAAKSGRLNVVGTILAHCPQSTYLRDPNGRTFLHLVRFTYGDVEESLIDILYQTALHLSRIPEVDALRLVQDNDGNTPLHYAIKTGNDIAGTVLIRRCLESTTRAELDLVNKEGATIPDLFASLDVQTKIFELIRRIVPEAMHLARSSYGIRKTEMKDSANALSVVAGLLATITFAAAFQVPGGFNGQDGSPVLLIKPVFQAFIVFNTFAMCGSMLVLFYLLLIMSIRTTHSFLKVLDLSIFLLRASFYSTLMAFTTGVFVVTANNSLWLAIFASVLCFFTVILTINSSVVKLARFGRWVCGLAG